MHSSLKIKVDLAAFFSVFFLLLFCYTNDLSSHIYFGNVSIIVSLCLSLFFACICLFRRFRIRISYAGVFAILSLAPIIYNNANVAHYHSYFVISLVQYVIIIIYFILATNFSSWMKYAYGLMVFGSMFYAFFTILFRFTPGFYRKHVIPLFGSDASVVWTLKNLYDRGYMSGLTIHYSTNAIYLSTGFVLLGCWIMAGGNNSRKVIGAKVLLVFIVIALLMTAKRAHIIFSAAALFLCYVVSRTGSIQRRIVKIIGFAITALVIFEILYTLIPSAFLFISRFTETAETGDFTLGRIARWIKALELFENHKLTGIGWDGYKYYYSSDFDVYINVHNVYLQLLCETGVLGTVIYALMFGISFIHSLATYKTVKESDDYFQKYICLTSICFEVFFSLYCMTGNPLYDVEFLYPLMLCIIASENVYLQNREKKLC